MDTATTAAVTAIVTAPLTIALTKGVDAWLKIRKGKQDEKQSEFNQEETTFQTVIKLFGDRIKTLEDALTRVQERELECVKQQGILSGKIDQLEKDLAQPIQEEVRRLWRHDANNKANVEVVKQKVKELEEKTKPLTDTGAIPVVPKEG